MTVKNQVRRAYARKKKSEKETEMNFESTIEVGTEEIDGVIWGCAICSAPIQFKVIFPLPDENDMNLQPFQESVVRNFVNPILIQWARVMSIIQNQDGETMQ